MLSSTNQSSRDSPGIDTFGVKGNATHWTREA